MSEENEHTNYELFRESFSVALIERVTQAGKKQHPRKRRKGGTDRKKKRQQQQDNDSTEPNETADDNPMQTDQEELGDFVEFLASEIFPSLPSALQNLSHKDAEDVIAQYTSLTASDIDEQILPRLPASVGESVEGYAMLPATTSLTALLLSALDTFAAAAAAPPPSWSHSQQHQASECEICGRDWIPLTYHHLVPRSVHAKAIKRGWHDDERALNSVAWLCRACHSFVHRVETNESLAKDFYTVDLLLERQDVQDWAKWVGRVRWKAR